MYFYVLRFKLANVKIQDDTEKGIPFVNIDIISWR